MSAPKKIYLSIIPGCPGTGPDGIYEEWSLSPIERAENFEYELKTITKKKCTTTKDHN